MLLIEWTERSLKIQMEI